MLELSATLLDLGIDAACFRTALLGLLLGPRSARLRLGEGGALPLCLGLDEGRELARLGQRAQCPGARRAPDVLGGSDGSEQQPSGLAVGAICPHRRPLAQAPVTLERLHLPGQGVCALGRHPQVGDRGIALSLGAFESRLELTELGGRRPLPTGRSRRCLHQLRHRSGARRCLGLRTIEIGLERTSELPLRLILP